MFDSIKDIFRKRTLRRHASPIPTGILPLSSIRSAVTFIDVEDPCFDECKEAILAFYREQQIKGDIFFFDFRKIASDELLITSIQTTVLKRDLNWLGCPKKEKVDLMQSSNPDLFISLIPGKCFPVEYMAACSNARFKIGRRQIPDKVYDLILQEPKDRVLSQKEIFEEVTGLLSKIG